MHQHSTSREPGPRSRRAGLVLLTAAAFLVATATSAQEYLDTAGRWKTLNTSSWSGFGNDFLAPSALFFRDRQTGWMSTNRAWYSTTDGGVTWRADVPQVPVPHRVDATGFGIALGGLVSLDSGATWVSVGHRGTTVRMVAWDRTRVIRHYRDRNLLRLALSTDAGTTWRELDEMDTSTSRATLKRRSSFGDLPDAGYSDPLIDWSAVSEFTSASSFGAILDVAQPPAISTRFVARLTLDGAPPIWVPLPTSRRLAQIAGANELWDFATVVDPVTRATLTTHLVSSTDGGRTWDSTALPEWLDYRALQAFGNGIYMAPNGRTTDFGRTWTPITHHFYPRSGGEWVTTPIDRASMREVIVDTGCVVVAARYSLFARSTDLGRTWRQNISGVPPRTVAACRGRVVVGRDARSLLFSADSGETWIELGAAGALPEHLTTVWSVTWPDSVNEPWRVLAVGGFHPPGRRYEVRVMESSDWGRTWNEGIRVPELEKGLGPFEPLSLVPLMELDQNIDYGVRYNAISFGFAPSPAGGPTHGFIAVQRSLVRSTDGGRSWREICDTITFARMKMADALHGVATSVGTIRRPAAIYSTSDGGTTWTWRRTLYSPGHYVIDVGWLGRGFYQVLTPNMNRMDQLYSYRSSDSGVTWRQDLLMTSGFDAQGVLFWLDTADIHSIRPNAAVLHSTNGGESFQLLHPGDRQFASPNVGFDGEYLYLASPGNTLGRWRIARRTRLVAAAEPAERAESIALAPNPARDVVRLSAPGADAVIDITVVDVLGRVVYRALREPDPRGIPIDISGLAPGAYRARVVQGDRVGSAGFVVEGR